MKGILIWTSVLVYAYTLWSCANPVGLVGGEKDLTAPQVVKDGALPANMQTNFTKQEITFTFDEWVKLHDIANEVVVSPPLDKPPVVTLKKKELVFAFHEEEELKEDVTYTINFGEAVKDLTEGNPADLKYVFSTGDLIDSLIVNGSVTDALTGEAVPECLVMMYKNLSDTIVRTENPYYFGKTNTSGRFEIGNVKEGTYKIFALHEDQGQRYIFDSDTEGIGYLSDPITVSDTSGQNIGIEIFKEEEELRLKDEKLVRYGHAWFTFSREPYDLDISHQDIGQNLEYVYAKDSVHLWYDTEETFMVYMSHDTLWKDTVKIKALNREEYVSKAKLSVTNVHEGAKTVNKQDGISLVFSQPLAEVNNDLVGLYMDSTQTAVPVSLERDTTLFGLNIVSDWQADMPYELLLLPGAVTDIFGLQNDTVSLSYQMQTSEDYGKIKVELAALDNNESYIIRLLTKSKQEIKRYTLSDESTFAFELLYMNPGDYMIEVVLDSNKNGRWDTGSYDKQTYPEQRYSQDLETLRANWTVEVTVTPSFGEKK